jgi:hypothetical protein
VRGIELLKRLGLTAQHVPVPLKAGYVARPLLEYLLHRITEHTVSGTLAVQGHDDGALLAARILMLITD